MLKIEIYTKKTCGYCIKAKQLLNKKGFIFKEISIDENTIKREEMIKRSGLKSVPQIFINDKHIGGCDDLFEFDRKKLRKFL
ncbi:glutaredoxin 3 [Candidatus Pantoea edessiphila]|uniref:Glutaredoxin n=1 Tax=Candidatus Pantoea edessiphila TaxID=2044610 RepID=A0A2P5T0D0_9GAMM|nr:glutaredoxin 3 [Candidatus Pantoea edessiphila]PPI88035.1 glutaredoxin 3 [Candidatus Pantoea edessiphila]